MSSLCSHLRRFFPKPAKSQIPGDRLHAIYAASYAPTPGNVTFPLIWNEAWAQPAFDVTQAYLDCCDKGEGKASKQK